MRNSIFIYITLIMILTTSSATNLINKNKHKINFVTIEYQGELGNRLFQTATAYAYAKEHHFDLILPIESRSSKGLRTVLSRFVFGIMPSKPQLLKEMSSPYIYQTLPKKRNCCLKGFFISEKYFHKYQDEIRTLFAIPKKIKFSLQRKYPQIFNHFYKVALHIRTFSKDLKETGNKLYEIYPAPDINYIQKAIQHFPENALFVVCSDNINWCKKFLKNIKRNFIFIENQKSFEDFYLLSLCDHMITSNSTFSWWAAYLIQNPNKKIIVRDPWILKIKSKMEDIIPKNWTVIKENTNPEIPFFF
jgi:Glycosyl transferase family 11